MREDENRSRPLAKRLRSEMTKAEVILWSRLRRGSMFGHQFRRQHPIGPYVADFACVAAQLVVEVDGATHSSPAELAHDRRRDAFLRRSGWRVIRVQNEDVYRSLDGVLVTIAERLPPPSSFALRARPTPPP